MSFFDLSSFIAAGMAEGINAHPYVSGLFLFIALFILFSGGVRVCLGWSGFVGFVVGLHYVLFNFAGIHRYSWPITIWIVFFIPGVAEWSLRRKEDKFNRQQRWEMGVVGEHFPGKRITPLSTKNWLLTDISTGKTYCELTPSERELILKMHAPEGDKRPAQ